MSIGWILHYLARSNQSRLSLRKLGDLGDTPLLGKSRKLAFAPFARSSRTISACPFSAAIISAVSPYLDWRLTLAP